MKGFKSYKEETRLDDLSDRVNVVGASQTVSLNRRRSRDRLLASCLLLCEHDENNENAVNKNSVLSVGANGSGKSNLFHGASAWLLGSPKGTAHSLPQGTHSRYMTALDSFKCSACFACR